MGWISKLLGIFQIGSSIKGSIGEHNVALRLQVSDFMGGKGLILKNLYIPKSQGGTTEIDVLYITTKGLFVIESKNYSGFIFGSENHTKWTKTLFAGKNWFGVSKVEKHQFYNPIWQNNTHIKYLKRYLNRDIQSFSFIVFPDRCEIKELNLVKNDAIVCYTSQLQRMVKNIWDEYPDVLSEEEIQNIYEKLSVLTNVDWEQKRQHIQDIQNQSNSDTCPLCGGKLVIRTAKQGNNVGKQFYGCSNFPRCRFTKNL